MILKTDSVEDMIRLNAFMEKYKYIFTSGGVKKVYYTHGAITITPTNEVINNLDGKYKEIGDDSWRISIVHEEE